MLCMLMCIVRMSCVLLCGIKMLCVPLCDVRMLRVLLCDVRMLRVMVCDILLRDGVGRYGMSQCMRECNVTMCYSTWQGWAASANLRERRSVLRVVSRFLLFFR